MAPPRHRRHQRNHEAGTSRLALRADRMTRRCERHRHQRFDQTAGTSVNATFEPALTRRRARRVRQDFDHDADTIENVVFISAWDRRRARLLRHDFHHDAAINRNGSQVPPADSVNFRRRSRRSLETPLENDPSRSARANRRRRTARCQRRLNDGRSVERDWPSLPRSSDPTFSLSRPGFIDADNSQTASFDQ